MFKMSTIHANTCIQTTTPLRNRCRDDGVHCPAASTPSADVLSTFNVLSTHIMNPRAVDPLLKTPSVYSFASNARSVLPTNWCNALSVDFPA